jgi:hypothetical protein
VIIVPSMSNEQAEDLFPGDGPSTSPNCTPPYSLTDLKRGVGA